MKIMAIISNAGPQRPIHPLNFSMAWIVLHGPIQKGESVVYA